MALVSEEGEALPFGLEDVGCERTGSGGLGILGSFRHWC